MNSFYPLLRCGPALAALLMAPFAHHASGQWASLPGVHTPVTVTAVPGMAHVTGVTDGAGGAIFAWVDTRAGVNDGNLYVQRIDSAGFRAWGDDGTPVCDVVGEVGAVEMIADGAGGAYLLWRDQRTINGVLTHNVWIQRIDEDGQSLWQANGLLLREKGELNFTGPGFQHLMLDGTGGVYALTHATSVGTSPVSGNRLHRLTPTGAVASGWPAEGVELGLASALTAAGMVPDVAAGSPGPHGVALCLRGVGGGIYTRRVTAAGALGFSGTIPNLFGTYPVQAVCPDDAGGMFVVTALNAEIFVFRVKSDGTMAWPESDRRVILPTGINSEIRAVPDGSGGMFVTWFGGTLSGAYRTVAQRVSATGVRVWGDAGIDVHTPDNNSYAGTAMSDAAGGLIVSWGVATPSTVRAQRLDGSGTKLWGASGVLVSEPWGLTQLVPDQASGAIVSLTLNQVTGLRHVVKRLTLTGSLAINSPLARLSNISARASVGAGDEVLIPGFVVSGGSVQLLVRGIGPTLANFNVSGVLADPQITLFNAANQSVASNNDWGTGDVATIQAVSSQVSAFALSVGSKDAVLVVTLQPGLYTAVMDGVGGTTGIGLVELYEVGGAQNPGRLANMSVRAVVKTGDGILIPGIVIGGSEARTVLIRAIGPTLGSFGVAGALADPTMTLFGQGNVPLAQNDDWSAPNAAQIASAASQVGAFGLPAASKDAALLTTLSPGQYTAQISGVGNTTGVCLVEVYEIP